ncbi:MAG: VOC family protein, partial [Mesorhizobium sp.]
MTPSLLLESALYVTDLDAAEHFYGVVLGLEPAGKVAGRHLFFKCGDAIVLLFNAEATQVPPPPDARLPEPPHGPTGAGHMCLAASE